MRTAASIAALGVGRFDGEEAFIPLGNNDGAELTWKAPVAQWRSEERETFVLHSADVGASNTGPNDWEYLYFPDGNPGSFNRSDFGWEPALIGSPGAAYAAGLRLQENLSAVMVAGSVGWQLATIHYEFDQGDLISGLINPDGHEGVILNLPTVSAWATTGWRNSAIPTPTKQTLAPHLYSRFTGAGGGAILKALRIDWRWAGTP